MKYLLSTVLLLTSSLCFSYPVPNEFPPFRIAGNLYYVGTDDLASYLIVTPEGNILINSNLEETIPMIKKSIEKLGFKYSDTKILLSSHAHYDHVEGSKQIIEETNAQYMIMDEDVALVQSGGKSDFHYGNDATTHYPSVAVDKVLQDGETVTFDDTVLTAHLTPGHTQGSTTWSMQVTEEGKQYQVVILGSVNVNPGYKLINNTAYPNIANDYKKSFKVLHSLNGEIFLGAHAGYFDLKEKYNKLLKGVSNPFYDPHGYKAYIDRKEKDFNEELKKQESKA